MTLIILYLFYALYLLMVMCWNMCALCFKVLELDAINEENKRLQQIYDRQETSAVDVMKINREKNELHQTLIFLSESLEDAEKRMWNEEIKVSKAKELVRRWHGALQCKIIMLDAYLANS